VQPARPAKGPAECRLGVGKWKKSLCVPGGTNSLCVPAGPTCEGSIYLTAFWPPSTKRGVRLFTLTMALDGFRRQSRVSEAGSRTFGPSVVVAHCSPDTAVLSFGASGDRLPAQVGTPVGRGGGPAMLREEIAVRGERQFVTHPTPGPQSNRSTHAAAVG
jgi:hypothetical protein